MKVVCGEIQFINWVKYGDLYIIKLKVMKNLNKKSFKTIITLIPVLTTMISVLYIGLAVKHENDKKAYTQEITEVDNTSKIITFLNK